jgi:acyl carrier protein
MNADRKADKMNVSYIDRNRAVILAVVRGMAPSKPGKVHDEHRLADDLGFDSVRLIELAIALEQRLALPKVDLDEAVTVSTVGDVIAMIDRINAEVTR